MPRPIADAEEIRIQSEVVSMCLHSHMHINSSSRRRNSLCESDSSSSQAAVSELLGYAPLSLYFLDQTAHFLVAARITRRSWQKQVPAQSGKRPLTPTAHDSPSAGETSSMHQGRSNAPRPPDQIGSHMEAGPFYRSTRYAVSARIVSFFAWSGNASQRPRLIRRSSLPKSVALIREMAAQNQFWGAERIRGELLKLGIHVCKRTIQKYMRPVRSPRPRGQNWATFLRNHAADIWACDVRRFGAYEILPGRG